MKFISDLFFNERIKKNEILLLNFPTKLVFEKVKIADMTFRTNFFSNKWLIVFFSFLIQLAVVYQPIAVVCNFYLQIIFDTSFFDSIFLKLIEWIILLGIINSFSIRPYDELNI